ncbi:MAG: hypothetical protein KF833_13770 [Verrucomicrobiae bacterium]|nr:hypothetical protein [Verrucomicrobiae bacterium]
MIDQEVVVHLVSEGIYLGIKFLSWTQGPFDGPGGGGFSYERTTMPEPGAVGVVAGTLLLVGGAGARSFLRSKR